MWKFPRLSVVVDQGKPNGLKLWVYNLFTLVEELGQVPRPGVTI